MFVVVKYRGRDAELRDLSCRRELVELRPIEDAEGDLSDNERVEQRRQ
jgi:hypothetical protein